MHSNQEKLSSLFYRHYGQYPKEIKALPISGSSRHYYRLYTESHSTIGVVNADIAENEAFVYMADHFRKAGIPVPEVYAYDPEEGMYLQEDLGDISVFNRVETFHRTGENEEELYRLYTRVLDQLLVFQTTGSENFDYSKCYPRAAFDKQSMHWDLNYFKYFYLKLAGIPFDEQKLEEDFNAFSDRLLEAAPLTFLYRDFQSRNIMVRNGDPWFIDFQGGRKGSPAYDVASLLYDAKASLSIDFRESLLAFYTPRIEAAIPEYAGKFKDDFYLFVYIRIMQAFGAYGYRGLYEKKFHFLQSIPYAAANLLWLLNHHPLPGNLPELTRVLGYIATREQPLRPQTSELTVYIRSFSFKKGYPQDVGGHGGGFVFDCRALPNPGRDPAYAALTGKSPEVAAFLQACPEVHAFLSQVFQLTDASVENYIQRGFTGLSVNFGCTGGQHRSVFMAEQLARHLSTAYPVKIQLVHQEFPGI